MVDARAIGAGGGSLAWVDAAGILKVGPRSAGADPGPACYGRGGTQATVTDANVVLGRLAPEFLLAGDLELDVAAAGARARRARRARSGSRATASRRASSTSPTRTWRRRCASSRPIAATTRAARRSSPTAAPARCTPASWPRALQMPQVLIPLYPGAFSAFGALLADTRFDYTQTRWMRMSHLDVDAVGEVFGALEQRAAADFRSEGFAEVPRLVRSIDMRYVGQNWELNVAHARRRADRRGLRDGGRARSRQEHERFYGYSIPGEELEMLTFNVAAVGTRHCGRAAPDRPADHPGAGRPQACDVRRRGWPCGHPGLPARRLRRRRRDRRARRRSARSTRRRSCLPAARRGSTTSATSSSRSKGHWHERNRHRSRQRSRPIRSCSRSSATT